MKRNGCEKDVIGSPVLEKFFLIRKFWAFLLFFKCFEFKSSITWMTRISKKQVPIFDFSCNFNIKNKWNAIRRSSLNKFGNWALSKNIDVFNCFKFSRQKNSSLWSKGKEFRSVFSFCWKTLFLRELFFFKILYVWVFK